MNALAFLVHHRSVDLVGVSALHALHADMGFGDVVLSLRRDDAYVLEGDGVEPSPAWVESCLAQAHWVNPNKHRHAIYDAAPGALRAAESGQPWPRPWLKKLIASDRPDLAEGSHEGIASWLAAEAPGSGEHRVTLAAWDHESGVSTLPHGAWPSREARMLRAQLWTAVLRAEDLAAAETIVGEFALSESRERGLLIHPHMEGWATVGTLSGA